MKRQYRMNLSLAGRLKPICSVSEFNLDGSHTTKGIAVRCCANGQNGLGIQVVIRVFKA